MPEVQLWEVVGGENGGIVVRSGQSTNSEPKTELLSTGSIVRQVRLFMDRLQYERLTGGGPNTGWVSTTLKGQALLKKSDKNPADLVSSDFDSLPTKPFVPPYPLSPEPKPREAPWGRNAVVEEDYEDDNEEVEVDEIPADVTTEDLVKLLNEERKKTAKLERDMRKLRRGMKNAVSGSASYTLEGQKVPQIHPSAWVAPGAAVIGLVHIKKDASVWFNTTIRGDNALITIGEGSDVQDNSILHCEPGKPMTIGKNTLVGHNVVFHSCQIGNNCLIGMRVLIQDGARIGNNCLVAAGTQIPQNKVIPDGSMVQGNPCQVMPLEEVMGKEGNKMVTTAAPYYIKLKNRFKNTLEPSQNSAFCMVCA